MDVVAGLGEGGGVGEGGVSTACNYEIKFSLIYLRILNNKFRFIVLEIKMYLLNRNFYDTYVCLFSGLLGRTRCPRERCYGQSCWDSLWNSRLHSGIKQEIP